jgi:hypothetical protein
LDRCAVALSYSTYLWFAVPTPHLPLYFTPWVGAASKNEVRSIACVRPVRGQGESWVVQ